MPKSVFGGDHVHLVQALIAARKAAGLTQAELAAKIGKDQKFISLIERSQRRVDVLEFVTMARAMGQDPAVMFARILSLLSTSPQI